MNDVISTTYNFNGSPVKIEGNKIYLWGFGTTIQNHIMHGHWVDIPFEKCSKNLQEFLKTKT